MRLVTGIITAPRPVPTLAHALASLDVAGFPQPLIGDDALRLGNLQNFSALASVMLCNDADWFLICEDDVTWKPNAYAIMQSHMRAISRVNFGALSLHCTRRVSRAIERYLTHERLRPGIYESLLGVYTWGAQALLFSRASLDALVNRSTFSDRVRTHRTGLDGAIFGAFKELKLRAWYLLPCLARHDLGEHNSGFAIEQPNEGRGCDY